MESILNAYPIRECKFSIKDCIATLVFKDPNPSFIEKHLFKKLAEKEMKMDLDEIGTFVWQLCDGSRKVSDIIEEARIKFGDEVEPAQNRVEQFLLQLHKGKFLSLYKKK